MTGPGEVRDTRRKSWGGQERIRRGTFERGYARTGSSGRRVKGLGASLRCLAFSGTEKPRKETQGSNMSHIF